MILSARSQWSAATLAALIALAGPTRAQGPYAEKPAPRPAVLMTTGVVPDSPWQIQVSAGDYKIRVRHRDYPKLELEIDADGPTRDRHYEGITPIFDGKRLEGTMFGSQVSFLSPDHDAGPTERVQVLAMQPMLRIRFESGSYERLQVAGDSSHVFLEAVFTVNAKHQLEARLNGIYYILPPRKDTAVTINRLGGTDQRTVNASSPKSMEYFEGVTDIAVQDSVYGPFTLKTFIQRLQLQVHDPANANVFEFDLDHTFKDRGQKAVLSLLRFETPLN